MPCALIHPLLDWGMARGPGVQFLWPFSTRGWLSPVQFVPTAFYAHSAGGLLRVLFHPRTWIGIGFECASWGALLLALRAAPGARARWVALSAAGFLLIWIVYDVIS